MHTHTRTHTRIHTHAHRHTHTHTHTGERGGGELPRRRRVCWTIWKALNSFSSESISPSLVTFTSLFARRIYFGFRKIFALYAPTWHESLFGLEPHMAWQFAWELTSLLQPVGRVRRTFLRGRGSEENYSGMITKGFRSFASSPCHLCKVSKKKVRKLNMWLYI